MAFNRNINEERINDKALISGLKKSLNHLIQFNKNAQTKEEVVELKQQFMQICNEIEGKWKELLKRYELYKEEEYHLNEDSIEYYKKIEQYYNQNPIKVFILQLLGWINRAEEKIHLRDQENALLHRREEWVKGLNIFQVEKKQLTEHSTELEKLKASIQDKLNSLKHVEVEKKSREGFFRFASQSLFAGQRDESESFDCDFSRSYLNNSL